MLAGRAATFAVAATLAFGLLLARFINRFVKARSSLRPNITAILDPDTLKPVHDGSA